MNKLEKHFEHEREQLRMTEAEKSAMRVRLMSAMEAPSGAVPSRTAILSPYQWMFAPRSLAMFAVACLIVVTSGTAYAAEGSLPGTPLYPVKVKVIEPITLALATTPTAKAQANAAIATTRVKEAQTLAAKGTLTPQVAKEISDNYNVHARAALALVGDDSSDVNDVTTVPDPASTEGVSVAISATAPASSAGLTVQVATSGDDTQDNGDGEGGDTVEPIVAVAQLKVHTMAVMSAPASSTNTTQATGTVRAYGSAYKNSVSTTSSKATFSVAVTGSTTASTTVKNAANANAKAIAEELRASLSAQAKILNQINVEVRNRHTKNPR